MDGSVERLESAFCLFVHMFPTPIVFGLFSKARL